MKIWLDDDRDAPGGWTRAKTVEEVATLLLNVGKNVECMSLDYSLGISSSVKDQGVGVILWLIEQVMRDSTLYVPEIRIHSGSISGSELMREQRSVLYAMIGREVIPEPSESRIW